MPSRLAYQRAAARAQRTLEDKAETAYAKHFQYVVRSVAASVAKQQLSGAAPEDDAAAIVRTAFDLPTYTQELQKVSYERLLEPFVVGVSAEMALTRKAKKETTAQIVAATLENLPADIWVGPMPQWLLDAATFAIAETMSQEYWKQIHVATRDDIEATMVRAIEDGLSIRKIANRILESHGSKYSRSRATAIARTETGGMLNAGHEAGIEQLEQEAGFAIGKEWISVLGSTTRPTHAALNGVTTAKAGDMFTLGGVRVPYPSHHALPAKERVNCQCTIVSTISADALFED